MTHLKTNLSTHSLTEDVHALLLAYGDWAAHLTAELGQATGKASYLHIQTTDVCPPQNEAAVDVIVLSADYCTDAVIECVRQVYPVTPIVLLIDSTVLLSIVERADVHGAVNLERRLPHEIAASIVDVANAAGAALAAAAGRAISQIDTREADATQVTEQLFDEIEVLLPADAIIMNVLGANATVKVFYRNFLADQQAPLDEIDHVDVFPLLQQVIEQAEVKVIPQTSVEADWVKVHGSEWIQTWVGVPVWFGGRLVAVMNVVGQRPYQFTPAQLRHLVAVSDPIGAVLYAMQQQEVLNRTDAVLEAISRQNAFLFTSLTANNTLDELCRTIAETVVNVFGKTDCGVMLVDSVDNRVIRFARAGQYQVEANTALYVNGDGLVAEGIREGKVVYAPDVRNFNNYVPSEPRTRSELVVPLRGRTGVIGVLDLQSTRLDAFSRWDLDGLQAFAEYATTAIQNLRMFTEERNHNQELEDRVREHTAELNHAKERLEAILNRAFDAIVLLKPNGVVAQANRAFEVLFELTGTEVYGLPLADVVQLDHADRLQAALAQVQQERAPGSLEVTMLSQAGRSFDAELTVAPVRFRGGEHTDMVCTIRDVTKHKKAEASLRRMVQSERELNELKTRFILTVAHEFRTPLTVISSSSELIRDYSDQMTEDGRANHFQKIHQQIQLIELMLADVTLVQQAAAEEVIFEPELISMEPFCRDVSHFINSHHGEPEVVMQFSGENLSLEADPVLLHKMLTNLLENAVKYAPGTALVTFDLVGEPDAVLFQIRDEGIGIPLKEQPMLFEPFYRANNVTSMALQGTGLGLSIVRYAVERHHGKITIESAVGAGTTVTVRLPRVRDA